MARLVINLLGSFQVSLDGKPVSGFDSDKVRGLLAYLVVEADQPHRRERLAGLLWPDYPEGSARTNLRSALANLRKIIGDHQAQPPFLLITRQTIQFNRASDAWLDVHQFTTLAGGEPGHLANIERLESSVALHKGGFLEGFFITDSSAFEEWAQLTRQSFQRQMQSTLHRLAAYYLEKGAFEQALSYAQRQIELDSFQEAAHQQVMWILAKSGQRNEAIRHYDEYRELLKAELNVEPLETTQVMYQQLLKDEPLGLPTTVVILRREPKTVGECPYRGLAAFSESDAQFFYGREAFIGQLIEVVKRGSLVAVILGSSGSGKSSTVFAGLLPNLKQEENWLIIDFRPGTHPYLSLASSLSQHLEPDLSETEQLIETQKLAEALRAGDIPLQNVCLRALEKHTEDNRLLLVVDQFEELYTLCPEPDLRLHFLEDLLTTIKLGLEQRVSPVVLLITLRADFMGQALTHRPFADALQDGSVILGPMNRDELRTAIEKPAELQGAAFETGLVTRILDDVGEAPGNLPLLEFTLTLLWERMEQGWFTHEAYDAIGRVDGALVRYAEEIYANLTEEEQIQARQIFIQLVQPGVGTEDTRRAARRGELGAEDWALVQHLADQRLVVTGRNQVGDETAEVVHEALIWSWDRLQSWMEENRAFRVWQEGLRVAYQVWEESAQDEGALIRGAPLVQAETWLVDRASELSPKERAFIQASLELRERRQKEREQRRRRIMIGLVSGLVLALILTTLAGQQWRRAENAGALAVARQATAQQASTLAIEGRALAQTAQVQEEQQRAVAVANAEARATAQTLAEAQARTATSRVLAAAAIDNLDVDPERSILLAMQAVDETYAADQRITQEAKEALHRSIQASRIKQTIKSENEKFYFVKYSPDGTRLITWSYSDFPGYTKVWEADTGEELLSLPGVIPLYVHPTQNRWSALELDYENNNDIFTIRNLATGKPSSTRIIPLPSAQPFRYAYEWNFDRVVKALRNGDTEIWDLRAGQEILHLGGDGRIMDSAVAFSPGGEYLATGNMEGVIQVWNLENGEELFTIQGHTGLVHNIAFSPDGKYVASASGDGTTRLWDAESRQELVTLTGHTNEVMSLAFSQDGFYLATGSWDRTVKIWDLPVSVDTGIEQELLSLAGHTSFIWDIDFSPDGTRLSTASEDGTLRVWDISPEGGNEAGLFVNGPPCEPEWSPTIALSPDGMRLATTNADQTPKLWDTTTGEHILTLYGHQGRVQRIEFNPDGNLLVTTDDEDTIKGWDTNNGNELFSLGGFDCSSGVGISCNIAFSPDGKSLAIVDYTGILKVFDVTNLLDINKEISITERFSVVAHDDWIWDVAYSPTGDQIATTSREGTAKIWNAETGEHLSSLSGHEGWVIGVAYSPDGKRIVTTSSDGTARVWDALTGEWLFTMTGHGASVLQAVFSPDGSQIATASTDMLVKLWDAETGQEIFTLHGHTAGVSDVAFSLDGKRLYSTSQDGTTRVYLLEIEELMELARERLTRTLTDEECRQYLHLETCPN